MTDSLTSNERTTSLSDDLAQRVLARAIELDVQSRGGTSMEQLRSVARELGVADNAFDRAVAELQGASSARSPGTVRSLWDALRAVPRSADLTVVANLATFGAFWGALGAASWVSGISGFGWEVDAALRIAVNLAGVSLARHLRARAVGFVLATSAIAQLAEYAIHLVYGLESVQGAATHFAVLLAAALGVAIASWERRDSPAQDTPVVAREEASPSTTTTADRLSHSRVLRARPSLS